MAVALKNRPVLKFPQPPGVTMAQWDTGSGVVTDAFKPDQVPGASRPIGGAVATTPRRPDGADAGGGGTDSARRGRQQPGRAVLAAPSSGS